MGDSSREAVRLEWPAVSARRLERSALAAPSASLDPAGIAGALCGAHAQVLSAAELSIGLRGEGLTRSAVRAALWDEASLIKMHGPRVAPAAVRPPPGRHGGTARPPDGHTARGARRAGGAAGVRIGGHRRADDREGRREAACLREAVGSGGGRRMAPSGM